MKRSNLFLAATTGLLAIASFAFAKSHARGTFSTGYCLQGSPNPGNCPTPTVKSNHFTTQGKGSSIKCANQQTVVTQLCGKALDLATD